MALIIEDGSQVANANSYSTLAELRAFALARGVTLSAVDATLEASCLVAMDYLESFSNKFKGSKVSGTQSLQFPRLDLTVDGFSILSTVIHPALKKALGQLVVEIHNGIDLTPTGDGKILVREKVDVIENEWKPGNSSPTPALVKFDMLLAPLLKNSTGGLSVSRA